MNLNLNETWRTDMATLTIKDLTASKELDGKAMAAVAGGTRESHGSPLSLLLLDITTVSTNFPVDNWAVNESAQANAVGSFNFGVADQNNSAYQGVSQLGNLLIG
jgi:hypothetical protein